jgi:hypothetical protein
MNLLHLPSQAAHMRAGPLPEGVSILLRIAAGDAAVTNQASTSLGRPRETVRDAATFFLEQILLHSDSDSYRVLGASREANYPELRRNMTLLLQWLHPDMDRDDLRSVFATRVTRAWNDLKTPERRAAYDRARCLALAEKSRFRALGRRQASFKNPLVLRHIRNREFATRQPRNRYIDFVRRALILLFSRSVYK